MNRHDMAWQATVALLAGRYEAVDAEYVVMRGYAVADAFIAHRGANTAGDEKGRLTSDLTQTSQVGELVLPTATRHLLEALDIETVGGLIALTEHDLLKRPGFGRAALRAVRHALDAEGLTLGMTPRAIAAWGRR